MSLHRRHSPHLGGGTYAAISHDGAAGFLVLQPGCGRRSSYGNYQLHSEVLERGERRRETLPTVPGRPGPYKVVTVPIRWKHELEVRPFGQEERARRFPVRRFEGNDTLEIGDARLVPFRPIEVPAERSGQRPDHPTSYEVPAEYARAVELFRSRPNAVVRYVGKDHCRELKVRSVGVWGPLQPDPSQDVRRVHECRHSVRVDEVLFGNRKLRGKTISRRGRSPKLNFTSGPFLTTLKLNRGGGVWPSADRRGDPADIRLAVALGGALSPWAKLGDLTKILGRHPLSDDFDATPALAVAVAERGDERDADGCLRRVTLSVRHRFSGPLKKGTRKTFHVAGDMSKPRGLQIIAYAVTERGLVLSAYWEATSDAVLAAASATRSTLPRRFPRPFPVGRRPPRRN